MLGLFRLLLFDILSLTDSHDDASKSFAALLLLVFSACEANAILVTANSIADANYLGNGASGQDRFEMILGDNASGQRYGVTKFDTTVFADFVNPAAYSLTSIHVRLHERAAQNGNNGTQSGNFGAWFLDTANNGDWQPNTVDADTHVWFGNTTARPGNFGGGASGNNNVDARSTSHPVGTGLSGLRDGISSVVYTFSLTDTNEFIDIDLTTAGGSLTDIQSILADWVAGDNAGPGIDSTAGSQTFFGSLNVPNLLIGESGNGDSATGAQLILNFEAVAIPEPGVVSVGLLSIGCCGLISRRRQQG